MYQALCTQYSVLSTLYKVLCTQYIVPFTLFSPISILARLWPHESHTCKLKFGSWTAHGRQIKLGLYNNQDKVETLNYYTDNKEWRMTKSEVTTSNSTYPGIEEFYPDVTFTLTVQRSSPAYRAGVILPCLVTMLLVLSTFLLPPSAGDKLLVNSVCFVGCVNIVRVAML